MTAKEKRQAVVDTLKPRIKKNRYSQDAAKRECVFTPYRDGHTYGDCSATVRKAYQRALVGLSNIGSNTVGIINNKDGVEIDCKTRGGVPTDIDALRVGDLLLFRGTDASRAYARYVGHVEMVYSITGSKVLLIGHGSGMGPYTHEMKGYCRLRYLMKVLNPKIKNRGLICVKRFIPDDPTPAPMQVRVTGNLVNIRSGPSVLSKILGCVPKGTILDRRGNDPDGWYGVTCNGVSAYISKKYAEVVR